MLAFMTSDNFIFHVSLFYGVKNHGTIRFRLTKMLLNACKIYGLCLTH